MSRTARSSTSPSCSREFDRLGYDGAIGCEYNPRAGTLEGLAWFKPYRRV